MASEGARPVVPGSADVLRRVTAAVRSLYEEDGDLLELDASERSITHKLAEHLQIQFREWHVDCEYNRRGRLPKRLVGLRFGEIKPDEVEAKTVFPDIIVHRRGTNENLLVIEVKKDKGGADAQDDEKLRAFGQDPDFAYRFGLFVRLGPEGCTTAWAYVRGERKANWTDDFRQALKELRHGG